MYFRKRLFFKQKIKLLKNYIVKQITYFYSFLVLFISYVWWFKVSAYIQSFVLPTRSK